MECRLEFMEFMLLNSNLEIAPTDRSYVTVVWTTLVRDALTMVRLPTNGFRDRYPAFSAVCFGKLFG
jgi:hypothetical protein